MKLFVVMEDMVFHKDSHCVVSFGPSINCVQASNCFQSEAKTIYFADDTNRSHRSCRPNQTKLFKNCKMLEQKPICQVCVKGFAKSHPVPLDNSYFPLVLLSPLRDPAVNHPCWPRKFFKFFSRGTDYSENEYLNVLQSQIWHKCLDESFPKDHDNLDWANFLELLPELPFSWKIVSGIALWRFSLSKWACLCHCLLIALIKCLKGHKSPG